MTHDRQRLGDHAEYAALVSKAEGEGAHRVSGLMGAASVRRDIDVSQLASGAATAWLLHLDQLYAGRLVSFVSTIVSAVLIGILTNAAIGKDEDRAIRATAGVMAALCFASLPVVLNWSLLMRVDMLAGAFTLIGMLLAVRAVDRPGGKRQLPDRLVLGHRHPHRDRAHADHAWTGRPIATSIRRDRAGMALVADRIRASPKPVIGDEMVLLLRAGQPALWEPAIAAELGSAGLYDERAFAAMVRWWDFGFFVTRGDRGTTLYDQRYNPVIADAMDAACPRREIVGDLVLHLPAR